MVYLGYPSLVNAYCCCLSTPLTLASGGVSGLPACGPPASFFIHLACSAITPAGSVHKSRCDNVVRMWVQLKRWCVWMLQRGHSGDGCDLASTLYKYYVRTWMPTRWGYYRPVCVETDVGHINHYWWRLAANNNMGSG